LPYLFRGAEAILTADAQEILTPSDQTPITTALQTAKIVRLRSDCGVQDWGLDRPLLWTRDDDGFRR
jgi:hypothetical protein